MLNCMSCFNYQYICLETEYYNQAVLKPSTVNLQILLQTDIQLCAQLHERRSDDGFVSMLALFSRL
jgi:hypothetical protein